MGASNFMGGVRVVSGPHFVNAGHNSVTEVDIVAAPNSDECVMVTHIHINVTAAMIVALWSDGTAGTRIGSDMEFADSSNVEMYCPHGLFVTQAGEKLTYDQTVASVSSYIVTYWIVKSASVV